MKCGLLFFLVLITIFTAYAQTQNFTLQNFIPPSPEAAGFVKYGTNPIGAFTGKPDINVPVYEIKTKNFTIPVLLNYDATGIRVDDNASWVGMNWSLNAGGMIARSIIGKPDDINSTSIYAVPPRASEITNTQYYVDYLAGVVDGYGNEAYDDLEPDRFYYSFNGRSGCFIFDRSRNIIQLPQTSLKITAVGNDANSTWSIKIVDETGTEYIFNIPELTQIYTANGGSSNIRTNSTGWYLSEIVSNDGLEHIYFTYETETTGSVRSNSFTETYARQFQGHRWLWSGTERTITSPRLKTISFTNGKVEFTRVQDRQDDLGSRLDEVAVYQKIDASNYSKLKSFKLRQGYYYSAAAYSSSSSFPPRVQDRYRLRLDGIDLKDAAGQKVATYDFSYNQISLPPKTSCGQDWWGYANGRTDNTTLVPTTTGMYGELFGGGSREPDEANMKAGILEKIIYPTGGYTVFETEAHQIISYTTSQMVGAGITGVGSNGGTHKSVQTFTTPANPDIVTEGKLSITIFPYSMSGNPPYDPSVTDPDFYNPPYVKIKQLPDGPEHVFYNPDPNTLYQVVQDFQFMPGTSYEITASCFINQNSTYASLGYQYKWINNNSPHNVVCGGLRVKSIKNYSSYNGLANEEEYRYGQNENGTGTYVGIIGSMPTYFYETTLYQVCTLSGGGNHNQEYKDYYTSGSIYDAQLIEGSPVVYPYVTKYYGTTASNAGKTEFFYGDDNQARTLPLPIGSALANNIGMYVVNDSWKKGHLIWRKDHVKNANGTYSLLRETINTYNTQTAVASYGLIAGKVFEQMDDPQSCVGHFFNFYNFADDPLNTGYVQLTQTITKEYDIQSGNILQTTVVHAYDNVHHDIETLTTTTSSKGETIEIEKKYPFNKSLLAIPLTSSESTVLDNMVARNMVAGVIEEIQRKAGTQLSLTKTTYDFVNAATIAPVNLKHQLKNNPIETRILYGAYNGEGNLLEQQKTNDVKTVYVWGADALYPMAQVIGSDQTTVAALVNQSVLDNSNSTEQQVKTELDNLRNGLLNSNALVTTYTYKPLVGMTSQTDPNGRTTYYEYDAFGRLSLIRDQDHNVLKKFCYTYQGQPEGCASTPSFGNAALNGYYASQSCPAGQTPLPYYVTVPAGQFTASTQAEADALARQYAQSQANQYGNCQSLEVQLAYSNYSGDEVTVELEDVNGNWYFFTLPYGNGFLGFVPPGTYNVYFWPNNYSQYHSYSAGCGYYTSGAYNVTIAGVPLSNACNNLSVY